MVWTIPCNKANMDAINRRRPLALRKWNMPPRKWPFLIDSNLPTFQKIKIKTKDISPENIGITYKNPGNPTIKLFNFENCLDFRNLPVNRNMFPKETKIQSFCLVMSYLERKWQKLI